MSTPPVWSYLMIWVFLDSMFQDFESDEQLGSAIKPKVAAIMQSSFTKNFSEDKMQKLTDSYPRPQNCNALTSAKVNAEYGRA